MAMSIGELRNEPVVFRRLPKLDVAGSSPVARSWLLLQQHVCWCRTLSLSGTPFLGPTVAPIRCQR